jgi:hypothetical protein
MDCNAKVQLTAWIMEFSRIKITFEIFYTSYTPSRKSKIQLRGSVALTKQHPLTVNFALTSPTSSGRLVGTVHLWTTAMEFFIPPVQ